MLANGVVRWLMRRIAGPAPVIAPPNKDEPIWPVPREHLEFLFERLYARWELQVEELGGLDGKVSVVLGATVVLFGLVVAALPNAGTDPAVLRWLLVSCVLLAGAILTGIGTVWPRGVNLVPAPRHLWETYYAKSTEETMAVMSATLVEEMGANKDLRLWKARWLRAHMALLVLGVFALMVGLLKSAGYLGWVSGPPWW